MCEKEIQELKTEVEALKKEIKKKGFWERLFEGSGLNDYQWG